ncbi:MAG: single-stranded DNA-binding protein [Lachnospiraceae bacterium]|nr:single-stranded DNA-binding protein [Lachnospiraceae bacterium]
MNKVILMGRLTRDPEIRYSQGNESLAIARYTLAVDRRFTKKTGGDEQTADFIPCVAFGKSGEFAEKYFHQGTKVLVSGRIQTGSYTNKDGNKVYTTEVIIEEQEFAESKNSQGGGGNSDGGFDRPAPENASADGFMTIPGGAEDSLPFK